MYSTFKKKHLLFDDRFTMTMCTAITTVASLTLALHLELLLPDDRQLFYLIPIVIGILIGWKFGSIIKAPATLNGFYNGAMGGVMGKMIGAVLKNPALCNIPIQAGSLIEINMYSLAIFIACLLTLICRIVRFSFKV